jgi:hypothetical protein
MTFEELYALPAVVDLMTAARALGIGRTKAYRLAHDGQFPVRLIRPGLSYHVPTADLLKVLGITLTPPPANTDNLQRLGPTTKDHRWTETNESQ